MKLYKAKATVTVYFMSDRSETKLKFLAEDHLIEDVRDHGVEDVVITEVKGVERIEGQWEPEDFVPGSEDLPGDEPMGIKAAMEWAAKQRALPAAGKADA